MATLIHFALIVPFYADTETIQNGFRGMQIAAMRQPINRSTESSRIARNQTQNVNNK